MIALPGQVPEDTVAFKIVEGAYPELGKKELLAVPFPMSKDPEVLKSYHDAGADKVKAVLDQGKDVVFLTLGDPTVYSTYLYIHHRLVAQGYETEIVCGITSFCAVSARLNTGLVEKAEQVSEADCTAEEWQALQSALDHEGAADAFEVVDETGKTAAQLCEYIDAGMPVVFWATLDFTPVPEERDHWLLADGTDFAWKCHEHCLLLVGYDDEHYWFNDPWHNHGVCAQPKALVEDCHAAQGMFAVTLKRK